MSDPKVEPKPPVEAPAEADSPKSAFIFLFVVVSAIVLTGVVIGVGQYFEIMVRQELDTKVLGVENPVLRQLRADESARLSRYQWADQKAGVVRIPVERARELIVLEWPARKDEFVKGTSDAAIR